IIVSSCLSGLVVAAAPQRNAAPAAGPSEACNYLKMQDAAAALGEAVKGPGSTQTADPVTKASACEFTGSGLHRVHLNVMHFAPDMASVYKALCAQKTKDGLTGLGDVACWYNDKHQELQVLKGGTFFSIEMSRAGNPTEAMTTLAKKIYAE